MKSDPRDLIDGYFDDVLSAEQQATLNVWIKSDPDHARIFAQAALLHDRLRDSVATAESVIAPAQSSAPIYVRKRFLPSASVWSTAASLAVVCVGLGLLWLTFNQSTASAAIRELNRIMIRNTSPKDRTYEIVVEEVYAYTPRGNRPPLQESNRPPKPPLDGAILHVRGNSQFVLIRKTTEGVPFITGSNGQQSWAVSSKGPPKISSDIHHFDHDLPGHETGIPLTNLHDGLERLRQAYRIELSAVGPEEYELQDGETARMLTAIKKPKERGPQRVEIVYESASGRILDMRFVQMPYGPDRLDLRLSLTNENDLPPDFFEPTSHPKLDTEN